MVKCPSCGVENIPNAERCRLCGKEMARKAPQTDTTKCPHCGTINPGDEMTCSVCRRLLSAKVVVPKERRERNVVHDERPEIQRKPKTKMPIIGGILLSIVGVCLLGALALVTLVSGFDPPEEPDYLSPVMTYMWLAAILIILGAVAALVREWWPLAEVGAIVAFLVSLVFFNLVCMVFAAMSFAALLLISLSRAEFS